MTAQSTPQRKGILQLLDHGSALSTPSFQRSFAWGEEQVEDFWDDLSRGLNHSGAATDHFLGLVVVDDEGHIQDGQQRLATTLLLASEIYEAVERAKKATHTPELARDALGYITPSLRAAPNAALTIAVQDQGALLQRTGIRSAAPESVRRIRRARKKLATLVADDLRGRTKSDEQLRRLVAWARYLRDQAYVVVLTVPVREAHSIFETLNTRGVRLSNGDLVKSYLVARAQDASEAVSKWIEITDALKDARQSYETDLEQFLLHFYGSRYGKTIKKDLFANYRVHIEKVDPITVLEELRDNAVLYRALADPTEKSAFWAELGEGTREAVELLNGLNLKQLRYLLLAVLRDFAANKPERTQKKLRAEAIRRVTAWSVRGLVHNKTGGQQAESTYIAAAERIRDQTIDSIESLKDFMRDRKMLDTSDRHFVQEFAAFNFESRTSHNRARAVLYALEYYKTGAKAAMVARSTLSVEHVLPQSRAPGEWSAFDDEEHELYAHKLGNLLLIDGPSGANSQLGNKPWPAKKAIVKGWGPQTPLTTLALAKKQWTKSTIEARHKELSNLAAKAFKV